MKFLLDTDHLSILQRQSGPESIALSLQIGRHPRSDLCLSAVSLHEQVIGCHAYINRAGQPAVVVRGYEMLGLVLRSISFARVMPFDVPASEAFDRLAAQRLRVATMDLRIASIAISNSLVLLTRNVGDFGKIPGLLTEDWMC